MTILRPYIYRHTPYRPPPLYQGLGSRVLQGHRDPGSRVTMGYGVIGSRGHGSPGLLGHRVYHPRFLHYPYLQGHYGLGSRVTMVTGSPITRVSGHGLPLNHIPRVTMVSGHIQPWSYHSGLIDTESPPTASHRFYILFLPSDFKVI
jgi:hypothetical protein